MSCKRKVESSSVVDVVNPHVGNARGNATGLAIMQPNVISHTPPDIPQYKNGNFWLGAEISFATLTTSDFPHDHVPFAADSRIFSADLVWGHTDDCGEAPGDGRHGPCTPPMDPADFPVTTTVEWEGDSQGWPNAHLCRDGPAGTAEDRLPISPRGPQQHGHLRVAPPIAAIQVLTAVRQAHEELSRSGEAGYEPKLLAAGFKPGQGATTTPSRSIAAFLKSGGQPRAHSRSGRQSNVTQDEQQTQEELDAFYEWREPNSTEHYWDRLQTTPSPSMHNDKGKGKPSSSSGDKGKGKPSSSRNDKGKGKSSSSSSSTWWGNYTWNNKWWY